MCALVCFTADKAPLPSCRESLPVLWKFSNYTWGGREVLVSYYYYENPTNIYETGQPETHAPHLPLQGKSIYHTTRPAGP